MGREELTIIVISETWDYRRLLSTSQTVVMFEYCKPERDSFCNQTNKRLKIKQNSFVINFLKEKKNVERIH